MQRIRKASPQGVRRPFVPGIGITDPAEQSAEALEQIAVNLAALDHNIELLASSVKEIAQKLGNLVARR